MIDLMIILGITLLGALGLSYAGEREFNIMWLAWGVAVLIPILVWQGILPLFTIVLSVLIYAGILFRGD
jgi:hypothetical protein